MFFNYKTKENDIADDVMLLYINGKTSAKENVIFKLNKY